jgi:glutaredoxin
VRFGSRARPVREVTLVTRQGCHACHEAEAVVAAEAQRAGATYTERDVDADPVDTELWGHKVPVVLIDGEVHAIWGIDRKELRRALG